MALKKKRITEETDLDALLDEPGWVSVSEKRKAEIMAAIRRPPVIFHGGARRGAGRKPKAAAARRVSLSLSVSPQTVRRFRSLAKKQKASLGVTLDRLIAALPR